MFWLSLDGSVCVVLREMPDRCGVHVMITYPSFVQPWRSHGMPPFELHPSMGVDSIELLGCIHYHSITHFLRCVFGMAQSNHDRAVDDQRCCPGVVGRAPHRDKDSFWSVLRAHPRGQLRTDKPNDDDSRLWCCVSQISGWSICATHHSCLTPTVT